MSLIWYVVLGAACGNGRASEVDPGPGSPVYQRIQWTGMIVEDLPSAVEFYRDTVGLVLVWEGDTAAWFELADGSEFELKSGGSASPTLKPESVQSAMFGFEVDNIDEAMATLEARGVTFFDEGSGDGHRWVYFADPEGNRLEIKQMP